MKHPLNIFDQMVFFFSFFFFFKKNYINFITIIKLNISLIKEEIFSWFKVLLLWNWDVFCDVISEFLLISCAFFPSEGLFSFFGLLWEENRGWIIWVLESSSKEFSPSLEEFSSSPRKFLSLILNIPDWLSNGSKTSSQGLMLLSAEMLPSL